MRQARRGLRHLGVSNVTAEQVAEAQSIAPIVCVQNMYNLAYRHDDELIDRLATERVAYVPSSPSGASLRFSPRRKKADGKAPMEAMRCVKRRLSDIVYQQMLNDAVVHTVTQRATGPGGQKANDSDSSVTDSHPDAGSSEKPLPEPAANQPKTPLRKAVDTEGSQMRAHRRRPVPVSPVRGSIANLAWGFRVTNPRHKAI